MATYQITSTHPRFLGTSQRATRRRLDAAVLYFARQVYNSARVRALLDTPAGVEAVRLAESVALRGLALGASFEVQLSGRTFRLERLD